jgi:hypothetical protein
MTTATKKTTAKKEEVKDETQEEIEIFEAVAKSVKRTLVHPETGEKKEFSQHELAFIPKMKFFRLVSGTLRLAAENEGGANLIAEILGGVDAGDNDSMVLAILRLVELSPDFLEEAFLYALNVKPVDHQWVLEALETIDDETGADIIDVFIAQNGPAVHDFLTERLPKMGKRVGSLLNTTQEQE